MYHVTIRTVILMYHVTIRTVILMYHATMRSVNYDLVLQSFVKYIQNGRVYMLVKCTH